MRLYDSAGQLKIVMPGGGGGLTNINVSAGTTSNLLSAVTFGDANGVSFGLNGSTITGSHNGLTSQSNQAFSADASSTFQTLTFQNSNGISFSNNAGALRVTHDLMFSTSRPAFSADASSTFQTLTFQNSNNVSFSNNGGAIRITHNLAGTSTGSAANILGISMTHNSSGLNLSITAPVQTNQTGGIYVTAQSTGQSSSSTYDLRTLSIVPDGIISAGWSNGSFRISATQSNQAFSAAGGSSAFQTLSFGDTNSVSFTNTNGSVGIASIKLQMFAVSNTTQSSSGTANHTALSFGGAGIASVGITGGSVVISVPAGGGAGDGGVFAGVSDLGNTAGSTGTVSTGNFVLVGTNGIFLSQSTGAAGSAATVTLQLAMLSEWYPDVAITAAGSNAANSSATIVPFRLDRQVNASQIRLYASISAATQTNTSSAGFQIGWSGVIYTRNAGTLSSLNSFSNSTSTIHQSNSTSSVANVRALTANLASASSFTVGEYWMMLHVTTTTAGQTSLAKGVSMGVVPTWASGFGAVNYFGSNTTNTRGVQPGLAIHSTGATRNTIAFSDITGHSGNSASLANLWFKLENNTVW